MELLITQVLLLMEKFLSQEPVTVEMGSCKLFIKHLISVTFVEQEYLEKRKYNYLISYVLLNGIDRIIKLHDFRHTSLR